MVRHS
jgi:hypothetical protein